MTTQRVHFFRILPEFVTGIALILLLTYVMRAALFDGAAMAMHDNAHFYLAPFAYFANGIAQFRLPLWNPYSHGGEPFFPIFLQLRLLDPITLATILLGKYFTGDVITLMNWERFCRGLALGLGSYLLLRSYARHSYIRVALLPMCLLSSITLVVFRQPGITDQCWHLPYVMFFALRLLHGDYRWTNWIGAALFTGVSFQSYFFVATISVLLVFTAVELARRRRLSPITNMFQRKYAAKLLAGFLLLTCFTMPQLATYAERSEYYITARNIDPKQTNNQGKFDTHIDLGPSAVNDDSAVFLDYDTQIRTGTNLRLIDFIAIVAPSGLSLLNSHLETRNEGYLYVGILALLGAAIGLAYGRNRDKTIWLALLVLFSGIALGHQGGVLWLAAHGFPPIRFVRHLTQYTPLISISVLFFFVIGSNRFTALLRLRCRQSLISLPFGASVFFKPVLGAAAIAALLVAVASLDQPNPGGWPLYPIFLFVAGLCVWAISRLSNRGVAALSVLIGMAMAAVILARSPLTTAVSLIGFLALPMILLTMAAALRRPLLQWGFITMVTAIAVFDLSLFTDRMAMHWSLPRIDAYISMDPQIRPHEFKEIRRDTPPMPYLPVSEFSYTEPVKYIELLTRVPSILDYPESYPWDLSSDWNFAALLSARRWSTLFMLKPFARLIHSGIAPSALSILLAVNEPTIQFRPKAISVNDAIEFLKNYPDDGRAELLRGTALIEGGAGRSTGSTSQSDSTERFLRYQLLRYEPERLSIAARVPSDGYIYIADGFDHHWRATIDGKAAPVLRANANFKAIQVNQGEHTIILSYEPIWIRIAILLFLTATAICILILPILALRASVTRQ